MEEQVGHPIPGPALSYLHVGWEDLHADQSSGLAILQFSMFALHVLLPQLITSLPVTSVSALDLPCVL